MATQRDEHIKRIVERAQREKQAEKAPMKVRRPTSTSPSRPTPTDKRPIASKPTHTTSSSQHRTTINTERSASSRSVTAKSSRPRTLPTHTKPMTIPEKFAADKQRKTKKMRHYVWPGIFFLFVAGFLLLSEISYLKYWRTDADIAYWHELISTGTHQAMNWCGRLGAIVSQTIIGRWFGISGILTALLAVIISAKFLQIEGLKLRRAIRSTIMVMCVGSVVAGHFLGKNPDVFGSGWGGEMGIYVAEWLQKMIGRDGTSLMLILGSVGVLYFVNANYITGIYRWFRNMVDDANRRSALRREAAVLRNEASKRKLDTEREAMLAARRAQMEKMAQMPPVSPQPVQAMPKRMPFNGDPQQAMMPPETRPMPTPQNGAYRSELQDNTSPPWYTDENVAERAMGNSVQMTVEPVGMAVESDMQQPIAERTVRKYVSPALSAPLMQLDNGQYAVVTGYGADGAFNYCYLDVVNLAGLNDNKIYGTNYAASFDGLDIEDEFQVVDREMTMAKSQMVPLSTGIEPVVVPLVREPLEWTLPTAEAMTQTVAPTFTIVPPVAKTRLSEQEDELVLMVEHVAEETAVDDTTINSSELYDPTLELRSYRKPPIELLQDHTRRVTVTDQELVENKNRIVYTLDTFGIKIDSIEATIGPTVTLYEIVPAPGVRISKIKNLEDDIALALAALGIRIIAPIPGKGTIGIEVPNKDKEIVSMYSVIKSAKFQASDADLPVAMGKTIQNETFVLDLAKMPHLLVAGATGQGKSVGLNAIITSLLYKKHPSELKFILIDPKKVELTLYAKLEKHFLAKLPDAEEAIITDTQKVIYTLNSICIEMDARYDLLKDAQVRSIKEYNAKFIKRRLNPEKGHRYLPYFVVIIDEFADLIMTAGREVETPIARIAQLARAVGIHLIIATQRPTTNIITGVIKANFPARIAFRVTSQIDSRTILDHTGANQLVGRGDMLISTGNDVTRVQCAFVDTPEVELIANHIAAQQGYQGAYELPEYQPESDSNSGAGRGDDLGKRDPLFEDVAYYVVSNQTGSASTIQRKFSIGFNRAGRIVDQLEAAGILGASQGGSKPRQVLIQDPVTLDSILN